MSPSIYLAKLQKVHWHWFPVPPHRFLEFLNRAAYWKRPAGNPTGRSCGGNGSYPSLINTAKVGKLESLANNKLWFLGRGRAALSSRQDKSRAPFVLADGFESRCFRQSTK